MDMDMGGDGHHHHHHPMGQDNDNDALNIFIDMNGNIPAEELRQRRLAILLDAPNEPPQIANPLPRAIRGALNPRKKRGPFTLTMNADGRPETCPLISNGLRAMQEAEPNDPTEFFANYLNEHMNSTNYPNGVGLPDHWGL